MILGVPPVAMPAPLPRKLVPDAALRQPLPVPAPAAAPVKPSGPVELLGEVSVYCKKQIGHWKETDARQVFHRMAGGTSNVARSTLTRGASETRLRNTTGFSPRPLRVVDRPFGLRPSRRCA